LTSNNRVETSTLRSCVGVSAFFAHFYHRTGAMSAIKTAALPKTPAITNGKISTGQLPSEMTSRPELFDQLSAKDHEQVVFCSDKKSGLCAIIAIHNTTLGPALGGARMWTYASDYDALNDVLRLSRGMTYKAAAAGLNLGGGKAVIIGDPHKQKTEQLFRAFGRFIEGLGGRYITAEDVGTSVTDMVHIFHETKYVTGIPFELGGSGDPSPVTAYGSFCGIKAAANVRFGTDSLDAKRIVIQGAGNVASGLAKYLTEAGAKVFITDIYAEKAKQVAKDTGAKVIAPDEIFDTECDIFAPAALGGVINDQSIAKLHCEIVAGPANNQLADEDKHSVELAERGILYAPDYVVNAGGLINVASELEGYSQSRALKQAENIYNTVKKILLRSQELGITTNEAANHVVEERIAAIGATKRIYASQSRFSGRFGEFWKRND
jgi:leucine dehydrogenase